MTNLSHLQIRTAKAEGFDLAQEIIAREGFEWAQEYFLANTTIEKQPVAWVGWFGFQDALIEHKGHYFRDGLLQRSY